VQGYLSAPAAKFPAAADILARTLSDPALPEARLTQLVRNRLIAIRQGEGNAETLAQRLFWRLILADGPYRRLAMSDPAVYERVTVADIDVWRRSVLVRDGLIVVAVGPFDAAQAGHEIDRIFAGLPQQGESFSPSPPVLRAFGKRVVLEKAVVQTAIVTGGPMDLVVSPDLVQAELAASALGGGSRGRLFKAVREKLGATYGISGGLGVVDASTRSFAIRTAVANDKAAATLTAISEQFAEFLSAGIADNELRPLQTVYVTAHQERLRRAPTLAPTLLSQTLNGFPDDYLATYEQRVRGYDIATINEAIRRHFPKAPLTTVVVAPSAEGLAADCVIKAPGEIGRCE
jgi:predicted Zn-dependent peptidase